MVHMSLVFSLFSLSYYIISLPVQILFPISCNSFWFILVNRFYSMYFLKVTSYTVYFKITFKKILKWIQILNKKYLVILFSFSHSHR